MRISDCSSDVCSSDLEVLVIVAVGGYQRLGLAGRTAELLLDFSPDLERRMVERRVEVAKLLVAQRPLGQSYAPVSQGVATEPGIGEGGVEFVKPEFRVVMQGDNAVKLKDRLALPDLQYLPPGSFAPRDRPLVPVLP